LPQPAPADARVVEGERSVGAGEVRGRQHFVERLLVVAVGEVEDRDGEAEPRRVRVLVRAELLEELAVALGRELRVALRVALPRDVQQRLGLLVGGGLRGDRAEREGEEGERGGTAEAGAGHRCESLPQVGKGVAVLAGREGTPE
jgi:hypothetical protein